MKKKIMFIFMFFIMFGSIFGLAIDDIPGDAKPSLPKDNAAGTFSVGNLFSIIFSLTFDKSNYDVSKNIRISQSHTSWDLECERSFLVLDIYQNGEKPIWSDSFGVGSISGNNNKQGTWTIHSGTLSEGTYGALGYIWCADSVSTFVQNNNCLDINTQVCNDYRSGESQRISNYDLQDFTITSNQCNPQEEVCDQRDNDCDDKIDELNVCGTDCLTQNSQKCYNEDVWYYDSCGEREFRANDCLPTQYCSEGRCVDQPPPICTQVGWKVENNECIYKTSGCDLFNTLEKCQSNLDGQPKLAERQNPTISVDGNKVTGHYFLRNDGEDMPKTWILEQQVNPRGIGVMVVFGFVSAQKQCNPDTPQAVHREFKLKKGEQIDIVLTSNIPDDQIPVGGRMDVFAIITESCGATNEEDYKFPYLAGDYQTTLTVGELAVSCGNEIWEPDLGETCQTCPEDNSKLCGDVPPGDGDGDGEDEELRPSLTTSQIGRATSKQLAESSCDLNSDCENNNCVSIEFLEDQGVITKKTFIDKLNDLSSKDVSIIGGVSNRVKAEINAIKDLFLDNELGVCYEETEGFDFSSISRFFNKLGGTAQFVLVIVGILLLFGFLKDLFK